MESVKKLDSIIKQWEDGLITFVEVKNHAAMLIANALTFAELTALGNCLKENCQSIEDI